ncbi:DNA repair protein RecO [Aquabacterium sp.]|uniref:DNA repair protein RecO n=1 Tax=Aquabacterium sp. TaxID=1872578 RepID=UPI0035B16F09
MAAPRAPARASATRPAARAHAASEAAFVLHHYDWSESSLILDLFTREHGRVAVVAKGAKRPYSQLRAVLLPFQRLNVNFGTRRGEQAEVQTLKSAEWQGGGLMLGGGAMLSGFYLNELLMKLLARNDAHPTLFDAYALTLPHLGSADLAQVQSALRAFELVLLREHGVLPALDQITQTLQPLDPQRAYSLLPEVGLVAARDDDGALPGAAGAVWCSLEQALAHQQWAALQQVCALALTELKGLLRGLLQYHLGSQTLRTRQLMIELAQT